MSSIESVLFFNFFFQHTVIKNRNTLNLITNNITKVTKKKYLKLPNYQSKFMINIINSPTGYFKLFCFNSIIINNIINHLKQLRKKYNRLLLIFCSTKNLHM